MSDEQKAAKEEAKAVTSAQAGAPAKQAKQKGKQVTPRKKGNAKSRIDSESSREKASSSASGSSASSVAESQAASDDDDACAILFRSACCVRSGLSVACKNTKYACVALGVLLNAVQHRIDCCISHGQHVARRGWLDACPSCSTFGSVQRMTVHPLRNCSRSTAQGQSARRQQRWQ